MPNIVDDCESKSMSTLPGPKNGSFADVDTASDAWPSFNLYRAFESWL